MFFSFLSFFTFFSSVAMGIIGLYLDPKSGKNRSFAFFSFMVSIWALGDIFCYIVTDKSWGWFWYRITSIGWCGMIFGSFYICMEFAGYYKKTPFIIKASVFIYSVILIIIQFRGSLFLKDFNHTEYGLIEVIDILSPGFFLLHGGMFLCIITGTVFLIKAIIESGKNRIKKELTAFIMIFYISYFLGVGLNVFQAFIDKPTPPFGPVFMIVFIAGILYLMFQYRLLRLDYSLLKDEAFDLISDFIIIISPENKVINMNQAGKAVFKLPDYDVGDIFTDKKEINKYLNIASSGREKIQKKYILFKDRRGNNIPAFLSICSVTDKFQDHIGSILIAKKLHEFDLIADQYNISDQEKKVILYLREGLLNKEISCRMKLADGVVKNYIHSVYRKTDVKNRVELLRLFFPSEV